jgi:hypothetical protein
MDPIMSLDVVREAITFAVTRLASVEDDDAMHEFASKQAAYLNTVVDRIDADIQGLRDAL